jgi:hypothetical protein
MKYKITPLILILCFYFFSNSSFSQQALLSSGGNSTDGSVSYSFGQFAQNYFVNVNASVAQGVQHPWEMSGTFVIPDLFTVSDTTFLTSSINCFGALQTIKVAGDDELVLVQSGASVDFIAGQSVQLLYGFNAYSNSNVHVYITTNSDFCDNQKSVTVVSQYLVDMGKGNNYKSTLQSAQPVQKGMKIYPNPNNGRFTIRFDNLESNVTIYIYNTIGSVFYQSKISNSEIHAIDLGAIRKGLYFVRIGYGREQFTQKIIVD